MTVTGTTQIDLKATAEAVATTLATALGLGEDAEATDEWPIGDGDTVLSSTLSGDIDGAILLAVNDQVGARLLGDPDTLGSAMTAAAAVVAEQLGVNVVGAAPERNDAAVPTAAAGILDDGRLTSLAAIVLVAAEPEPDEAPAPSTNTFEPAVFEPSGAAATVVTSALSVLNDVEMVVTAELGRTTMPMRELLSLTPGQVVEIDRAAGSPIDLLVNGRRIATGEVVVIDEEFGIRITEITAPAEQRR